jgi:hypothetical protein
MLSKAKHLCAHCERPFAQGDTPFPDQTCQAERSEASVGPSCEGLRVTRHSRSCLLKFINEPKILDSWTA